ncbi:hypothetical protein DVS77_33435 [Mycolicibacterium moriokaense]|nr:hypothetical protein DVS77_33435 [Mycolicibacterium moriokaense]
MRAPVKTCFRRSTVAVLASGVVISMSALTGGVAPALAKPGDHSDPGIPIIPTPEVVVPDAPAQAPAEKAPEQAPRAPKEQPAPKPVAPPRQQAPAPEVQAPAPQPQAPEPPAPQPQAPAPQVQAPVQAPSPSEAPAPTAEAPAPKKQPRVVDAPKADPPKAVAPKVDAPPQADPPTVSAPAADAPKLDAPKANPPKADAPTANAPKVDTPAADVPSADMPAPPPAADLPATPGDPKQDPQVARDLAPGQQPGGGADTAGDNRPPVADQAKPGGAADGNGDEKQDTPSSVAKAAARIPTAAPDQMQAPEQDLEVAKQSKPVELKPEPAKKDDVDFLSSAINLQSKTKLGPFESEFNVGSEFSIGDRDRDRDRGHDGDHDRDRDHNWDWDHKRWDKKVRQWDKRWIQYDDWYRPVFCNPYRAPVRIVYLYQRAPRILVIPPLGRAVVDAAALAAYSFTAVVLNSANLAADVAVGTFFGGGYIPPVGAPFVPPPPLSRYDNVPVQVRYSNATYQPFRVNQIVDVGDDAQYGGRKVLLDGATPAWGQWTTSPTTGERQFEIHRTQQYPGLGEPQEAPLPGDYQMRLASDESANVDHTQLYLMAAAGLVAGLGFGALGLAFYLGRRRRPL